MDGGDDDAIFNYITTYNFVPIFPCFLKIAAELLFFLLFDSQTS